MSTVEFLLTPASLTSAALAQTSATAPPLAGSNAGPSTSESSQPLGANGTGGANGAAPAPNPFGFMLPILLIFGVMIFFQIFAGRKERRKRAEMLGSIAKYDKIQTVGGLIGSVHEVRSDEITLKVDESTNTKVHIARSAVQTVLRKGPISGGSSAGASETSSSKNETLEPVAS